MIISKASSLQMDRSHTNRPFFFFSPTSDGAACAILASESFVERHGLFSQAVEIVAQAMATDLPSTFNEKNVMKVVSDDDFLASATLQLFHWRCLFFWVEIILHGELIHHDDVHVVRSCPVEFNSKSTVSMSCCGPLLRSWFPCYLRINMFYHKLLKPEIFFNSC